MVRERINAIGLHVAWHSGGWVTCGVGDRNFGIAASAAVCGMFITAGMLAEAFALRPVLAVGPSAVDKPKLRAAATAEKETVSADE